MDQQRNLQLQAGRTEARRTEATGPSSIEPEPESSLLQEARGWSGSAREAQARIENERTVDLLATRRRNGPGQ